MENYHQQPGQLVQSLMRSIDKENRRVGGLTIEPIRSIVQSSSSSLFRLCSVLRFGRWDREYQIGGNQQRILAFSLLNEKNNSPGLDIASLKVDSPTAIGPALKLSERQTRRESKQQQQKNPGQRWTKFLSFPRPIGRNPMNMTKLTAGCTIKFFCKKQNGVPNQNNQSE